MRLHFAAVNIHVIFRHDDFFIVEAVSTVSIKLCELYHVGILSDRLGRNFGWCQSSDGLNSWNYFDSFLQASLHFHVYVVNPESNLLGFD